ncbi:MAG: PTS sugar transporter subunit IIA [Alphaproteobacteria bacterium]|nr:PTS sugar transporter subunit IIA [Alphaproteobacteria bacterium]
MIGVVVATHCRVASALAEAAEVVLGPQEGLAAADLHAELDEEAAWGTLRDAVASVEADEGVLVLVDMLGGTPSNLAMALLAEARIEVVTGVNLPMVLRALQHREGRDLESLAADVHEYGRRNVIAAGAWLGHRSEVAARTEEE